MQTSYGEPKPNIDRGRWLEGGTAWYVCVETAEIIRLVGSEYELAWAADTVTVRDQTAIAAVQKLTQTSEWIKAPPTEWVRRSAIVKVDMRARPRLVAVGDRTIIETTRE